MINKLLVTFFGLGYLPKVPGTWGSLGAIIVSFLIVISGAVSGLGGFWMVTGVLAVLAAIIGISLGRWSCEFYKSKDPKPFVLDEVAGQWVALLFVPFAFTHVSSLILILLIQFFLFRIYDIIKPTPARQAESLPHGWGIVTDDLLAGVYANLTGQIIIRFILPLLGMGMNG